MNLGITYVATGVYSKYSRSFFESLKNLVDTNLNLYLYIITNDIHLFDDTIEIAKQYVKDIKFNIITDLPYPSITLFKHIYAFNAIKDENLDLIMFLDADSKFRSNITENINNMVKHCINHKMLITLHTKYLLTTAPEGYAGDSNKQIYSAGYDLQWLNSLFGYEDNNKYTHMERSLNRWAQGCFAMAEKDVYLKFIDKMNKLLSNILRQSYIPTYNDETCLNKLYQEYCLGRDFDVEYLMMPYCVTYLHNNAVPYTAIIDKATENYEFKVPKKHGTE